MKHSEQLLQTAGETFEYARQYARQKVEYHKLDMAGRMAKVTSFLLTFILTIFLVGMVIAFLSIGLAIFLGQVLESYFWGFTIVGGFYLLITLLIYSLRTRLLTNPLLSVILKSILE